MKKFATMFMLPRMSADEAPKAYAVDDVVKPKQWVGCYKVKFAAPESGRYRFWGIGDDVLMVRVKKRLVIDADLHRDVIDWESEDERTGKYKMNNDGGSLLEIGDWRLVLSW